MRKIKGIILAGGLGSRLYPLTYAVTKHLLPVYDKPMIYYPLSTLINAGIRDILIITTKEDKPQFFRLLENGKKFGINISYEIQSKPNGIAESMLIGADFIGNSNIVLILGDNIFYGDGLDTSVNEAKINLSDGYSTIFGVDVDNPSDFGVIDFDKFLHVKNIEEKPIKAKSNTIVSGIYFYTNNALRLATNLKPSKRGELEITDLNNMFLEKEKLKLIKLDSSISWIDTGTYSSLIKASRFFQNLEKEKKVKFACIEEISFRKGYIDDISFSNILKSMKGSDYGKYLNKVVRR